MNGDINRNSNLDMSNNEPISEIENPQTNEEVYQGSLRGVIARNLGVYVIIEFLIGTNNIVIKDGILYASGKITSPYTRKTRTDTCCATCMPSSSSISMTRAPNPKICAMFPRGCSRRAEKRPHALECGRFCCANDHEWQMTPVVLLSLSRLSFGKASLQATKCYPDLGGMNGCNLPRPIRRKPS